MHHQARSASTAPNAEQLAHAAKVFIQTSKRTELRAESFEGEAELPGPPKYQHHGLQILSLGIKCFCLRYFGGPGIGLWVPGRTLRFAPQGLGTLLQKGLQSSLYWATLRSGLVLGV